MDEEIEQLVVQVRADTGGFAADVAAMRSQLDGPLAGGLERAGRALDSALSSAIRRGSLGFEDLRRVALSVLDDIARAAIESGLGALGVGAGGGSGGGLFNLGTALASAFLGAPGRATGGPVSPGRAYRVGENGPELFVPTSSGRVQAHGGAMAARDVSVTIHVHGGNGRGGPGGASAPEALQRSGRQVARAVRRAISN